MKQLSHITTGWVTIPLEDYENLKRATEILGNVAITRLTVDPWARKQDYSLCIDIDTVKNIMLYRCCIMGDIDNIESPQPIEYKVTMIGKDN